MLDVIVDLIKGMTHIVKSHVGIGIDRNYVRVSDGRVMCALVIDVGHLRCSWT